MAKKLRLAAIVISLTWFIIMLVSCASAPFTRIEADKIVTPGFTADNARVWIAPSAANDLNFKVPTGFFNPYVTTTQVK